MATYHEFVDDILDTIDELKGPFCPFNSPKFGHGYCNGAYSEQCYKCDESKESYILSQKEGADPYFPPDKSQ